MTAVLEDAKELTVEQWGTLNTAASPNKLPEGHSPNHQNVWVDEKPGSVVTALGYKLLGTTPSGNPTTLLVNFFKTSDGSSQLIVSDNVTVWYTTNYVDFTQIVTGLSGFFQLRAIVVRDKLWLTNGSDDVRTWDGTTLVALNGAGGTPDVPNGKYIAYHDERIWMYGISGDPSATRFTALTNSGGTEIAPDNASAWPTDNEIQISEGDADQGTGIFLYRGYLYCSKQYSIWRIVGYDEYTYTRVKTRASTGTRFQESIQIKDNLVHFIGVDGLYVFDGEEAKRISDIIDPSSPDAGVFAFRNLQQPLLNTKFWNVSDTADFAAGTVPNVLSTASDKLSLVAADDSQADFNSGTKTDVTADDSPGNLQLSLVTSGGTTTNLAEGKSASLASSNSVSQIGSASSITDGNTAAFVGFLNTADNTIMVWQVDLGAVFPVGSATVKSFRYERQDSSFAPIAQKIQYSSDNVNWTDIATLTLPASSVVNKSTNPPQLITLAPAQATYHLVATSDESANFATTSARYWRFLLQVNGGANVITELQIFKAGYKSTGDFVSASIDYGSVPASFGALAATITTNGETYQFSTQSSNDGSSWDSAVNVSNGAAIGSTLRRFLRWLVTLNSSTGLNTPVIDKVYVGGTYVSEVHDTSGNILQWGAFQSDRNAAGQTVNYYYRAATTSGGVAAASWTAIVPGAVPNTAVTNVFIQIRVEMSTADATQAPFVNSFTVNWVLSSASGARVLQNVASFIWLNRYWLAAATLGADNNDIVIVLGKSTFGSPWHQKDFTLLSFCRFQDIFIAGSSIDGKLYRLEYGYSKDGSAMDSFYETRDFSNDDFQMKGRELLITCDKSGSYNLSVGYSTDGGTTYTNTNVDLTRDSGEALSFTKRLNNNWMSDSIRFRVRINAADQPFSVDALRAYYRPTLMRGTLGE